MACHGDVTAFDSAHDPAALGCWVCHQGDRSQRAAGLAHRGMIPVPGNLSSVGMTCGRAGCHAELAARVSTSLMATARGIVSVDRFVFGEQPTPDGEVPISAVGTSPADTHLRQLCSTCHLSKSKDTPGPVTELSRGGGCVACHLRENGPRPAHPGLTIDVRDENCFGCHSRSGRISLSYAGWMESDGTKPGTRELLDGRSVEPSSDDVHHARGMACIDCHTAEETMGDGRLHLHEEQATHVRCETCHRLTRARTASAGDWNREVAVIITLRAARAGRQPTNSALVEDRSGEVLTHARPLAGGVVELFGKLDGLRRLATPPSRACRAIRGHDRLSCQSCHSTWISRCSGCHTQRDERGEWVEYEVMPRATPPTLGILERDGRSTIEPFAPGMVLTLGMGPRTDPLPEASSSLIGPRARFARLYAFAAPHTTRREARGCESCHRDPEALGYGHGTLRIVEEKGEPRWMFEPTYELSPFDRLPKDAWIRFRSEPAGSASTRKEARPLDLQTQDRALRVGACLSCHDATKDRRLFEDFGESLRGLSSSCRFPGRVTK
ncbi:MAG: hypothetical protein HY791_38480 [Deltaproteobacteria bacterium]|nr:hypothetical protein [Deltaproteobacteria bacterium]